MTKEIVNLNNIENYDNNLCIIGNLNENNININQIKQYLENLHYFKNIYQERIGNIVAPYGCDDLCGIALVKKRINNFM